MRRSVIVFVLLLICSSLYAYRVSRPPTLTYPLDENQINQLNVFLDQIWYANQGRVDLDIVTTSKTNARNGEIWIILTGPVARIQFKANNQVFTVQDQVND